MQPPRILIFQVRDAHDIQEIHLSNKLSPVLDYHTTLDRRGWLETGKSGESYPTAK
jgi:hypothetical protein